MRIVIDLQGAQGESHFRGIVRFSLWFSKALVKNNTEHDIHLALNGYFQDSIDYIRHQFENLLSQSNIHVWYPLSDTAYILGNYEKCEISEEIYKGFIKSLNPDVFISFEESEWQYKIKSNSLDEKNIFTFEKNNKDCDLKSYLDDVLNYFKITKKNEILIKKKLAYVSPVPPAKTGIADYSFELLYLLSDYYNIDIIIHQEEKSISTIFDSFSVRSVSWFYKNYHYFDRVLYHIGNSPFHTHMFDMLKTIPGVVVLHDFYLGHAIKYVDYFYQGRTFLTDLYLNHGWLSLIDYIKIDIDYSVLNYPFSQFVFEKSIGVIVHSKYTKELSKIWFNQYLENAPIPLLISPKNKIDKNNKKKVKKNFSINENAFVFSSFGNINPFKMSEIILNVFLKSKLKDNKNCYIILVGDYGGPYGNKLEKIIKESGIKERILLTGWTDQKKYKDYLMITDVAIQLRKNSRGETSISIPECMAYCIPTIINANGSMAEFPDDVVYLLEDEFKEEDLISALEKLYHDPKYREDLGRRGREYIEKERSPALCAKLYQEQIEAFYSKNHPLKVIDELCFYLKEKSIKNETLLDVSSAIVQSFKREKNIKTIFVDISVLVRQDLKTGIERVTRAILLELLKRNIHGYRVEPIYSKNNETYRYARSFTASQIGIALDDMQDEFIDINPGDVFFGLDWAVNETLQNRKQLSKWKNEGVRIITFLYDILPILKPYFFPNSMGYFSDWIETLSDISDQIICISKAVEDNLKSWILENDIERRRPLEITHINLGSDVENSIPTKGIPEDADLIFNQLKDKINFLMVGTVEPRKGHRQTLKAFDDLWADGIDVNLVIVGKQGWQMEDFFDLLNNHPERNKRLFWLSGISDEYLEKIYRFSTCLIAASEGEGYGLPIVEAAKHKLPIIARDLPVFREVSQNHAFFFDGLDSLSLSLKIKEWINFYDNNQHPLSKDIKLITWKESADQLLDIIIGKEEAKKRSQIIRFDEINEAPFIGEIDFSKQKLKGLKNFKGLSNAEAWGRWSDAILNEIILLHFKKHFPNRFTLTISGIAFNDNIGCDLIIKIDEKTYSIHLQSEFKETITVDLKDEICFDMEIIVPKPQLPTNGDQRKIGVGLKKIEIQEIKD